MKLVVGLGNPGSRYADSRHNVGSRILNQQATAQDVALDQERFYGRYGTGFVPHAPGEAAGERPAPHAVHAPALSANRVTSAGSPPNAPMFSRTHFSAAS